MTDFDYDIVVIGSGPAGQSAAIQAAKLGRRVAVIERSTIGGMMVNSGTIPSKTLREAALYLTGYRQRDVYGQSYTLKQDITMEDLLVRTNHVMQHETDVTRHQLMRNDVEILNAEASFISHNSLRLIFTPGGGRRDITSKYIVIATGTFATHVKDIPFDGKRVFVSDDILNLDRLPKTLVVVGAGVVGLEYASIFAALGVRVTLVDKTHTLLKFMDMEIVEAFIYHLRRNRVTLRLGEEVSGIEVAEGLDTEPVRIHLASGKEVVAEKSLYSIGRTGATSELNLSELGLSADSRGRISVNSSFQTEVPHVYGVGDVIGFPSLASTSMEQGRLAVRHALDVKSESAPELFPHGIYSIPEMAMVGRTEEELTEEGIPYEVGKAEYREISRGQILGDQTGLMKLIFQLHTLKLLGVHIIGDGASELVHIGQAVMAFGGTVEYFTETVFNYPTLAECYKTAGWDGLNRLGASRVYQANE